jgi:hypothetical protein
MNRAARRLSERKAKKEQKRTPAQYEQKQKFFNLKETYNSFQKCIIEDIFNTGKPVDIIIIISLEYLIHLINLPILDQR